MMERTDYNRRPRTAGWCMQMYRDADVQTRRRADVQTCGPTRRQTCNVQACERASVQVCKRSWSVGLLVCWPANANPRHRPRQNPERRRQGVCGVAHISLAERHRLSGRHHLCPWVRRFLRLGGLLYWDLLVSCVYIAHSHCNGAVGALLGRSLHTCMHISILLSANPTIHTQSIFPYIAACYIDFRSSTIKVMPGR